MISDLLGIKWKIGTIAFGAATLSLGIYAIVVSSDLKSTRKELVSTQAELTTAKNSIITLKASIAAQNAALDTLAQDSAFRLSDAAAKLGAAQKATKVAEGKSYSLQQFKPTGSTLEQRVLEVDAKVLESLK